MSTYVDKPISLIERKKLQWAKEREELARLEGRWGPSFDDQPFGRPRYESKFSMVNNAEFFRRDLRDDKRRSSLPPLYKNQYNSNDRYERDKDLGGETSGYGSDNQNNSPEYQKSNWNQSGYESSSSFRDDRPKWGDRGVGVGKFWQPKQEYMEKAANEPPNWVKRGLQDGEIIVSNTSPAESPQQTYEDADRPYTSSSISQTRPTYIRGQNCPIDSIEMAERERRRQIAKAHQEAIRQQLEERELRRREERERRIREEREEELRIERQQEVERQRKEAEQRLIQEKQERERKRKEAIQEALEIAEKEAKLEKMKLKMMKQMTNSMIQMNMTENVKDKEKIMNDLEEKEKESEEDVKENVIEEKVNNCEQDNNCATPIIKNDLFNNDINNVEYKEKINNSLQQQENRFIKLNEQNESINNQQNIIYNANCLNASTITPQISPRAENLPVFSLDTLSNVQYALIMPQSIPPASAIPIAVPINVTPDPPRTENRVLTPTVFRNRLKKLSDSCTQTDPNDFGRYESAAESRTREKNTNIDYDNRIRKVGRSRSRSESVEERPKWGANRPPTRYLKQSEKDLLYQRRKLRQKSRDAKIDDDKNSSDDSQTGTPRSYRKKGYIDKRPRGLWRKNEQVFAQNIRMYQTEIVPLEMDKDQIYYKKHEQECCCHCKCERHKYFGENVKVDILKIEHTSPRDTYKAEMVQQMLPDCTTNENNNDILDKLTSLHNGLLLKQEQWENSPRTPSLSSTNRR